MTKLQSQHVIAIGASAGGMEELHRFFDNTATDGVSYVIIQHLSPDFKSSLVQLLAKHSRLKVKEAEDQMMVENNHVYVIPIKSMMTIDDGRLHLKDKPTTGGPNLTINIFFDSLARERGDKAIGVILSGMGSDGSEGIKAIKKAGGMVIARDPALSEFNSMPSNAIATGAVDYILEPELMPGVIEYYIKNDGALLPHALEDKEDDKNIKAITALIKDSLPLDFSDYKQTTILRRIKRRAANLNLVSLNKYLAFLTSDKDEVAALAKDFLISVTSFFRDKEAFRYLQKKVIPKIIKQHKPGDGIKVWVAGCATGEEAYSLAILIKEQLIGDYKNTPVKIFATDIDTTALAFAAKGVYTGMIKKFVSPGRLKMFFTKEEDKYTIQPEIRKMLIFAQHDLVKGPSYSNVDLISCRNLLIYMTPALQKRILYMLQFGLSKNGYLFLGSSENAFGVPGLAPENRDWRIYKNIEKKQTAQFNNFSLPPLIDLKKNSQIAPGIDSIQINNDLTSAVNEALVSDLDYLVVCVDEKNHVVTSWGDTTKYLFQKNFNVNFLELLPKPLAVAYNKASHEALLINKKVSITGIKVMNGKSPNTVRLLLKPLKLKGEQKIMMVVFSDDLQRSVDIDSLPFNATVFVNQYNRHLEEEVLAVKTKLHDALEKIDASDEYMQSFNEELLAANEEMQSTNEEMQSVNEELHTINMDYELKNKELIEINDELNNYFRSNVNGQLYVNTDLLLMKFSPGTVKHINLLESDVGRPITNISTNIKFETMESDIKEVIKNGGVINREIESNDGKWYQMATMPYLRGADKKTYGAILSFNDITELKNTQLKLDKNNQELKRINSDLDNFVHTASHDLLGPLGNIEMSISIMNELNTSDPSVKKFLLVINSSVKKFRKLLKELAIIGKIENDMLDMEPVSIMELIKDIKSSIQSQISSSKTIIIIDLEVTHVHFSKKNLRSILYNLISNAIKFKTADHDPRIIISTRKEKDYVLLSIKDNGIGIMKSKVDQAFKMYGRLKPEIDGQGLGLYLAKKLVDAAGGNITVESLPGRGSTFTILLKTGPVSPGNKRSTKIALPDPLHK